MKPRTRPSRRLLTLVAATVLVGFGAAACSGDLGLRADKDRSRQESSDTESTDTAASLPPDGHPTPPPSVPDGQAGGGGGDVAGDVSQIPGFSQGVPGDWPSDVPVPDGATNVFSATQGVPGFAGQNSKALVMEVDGSPTDVSSAYKATLMGEGWTVSPLLGMAGESLPEGGIVLQKGGKTLMAFPTQTEGGRSQMMVMIVDGDLASLLQNAGQGVPPG